MLAAYPATVSW